MNLKLRTPAVRGHFRPLLPATLLGCALILRGEVNAQSVLAPAPEFSVTPPALQQLEHNEMEVFPPPGIVPPPELPPFRLGPVTLRPHAFYRFINGDGIPTQGSNHVSTIIQDISPGMLLGLGSHWTLDYTPTLRYYSSKQFSDTLDHFVRLTGGMQYEDWILGLSQSYNKSSSPLVETGTQTSQDIYLTALTASYRLNSKMSADLSAHQNIVSTDNFTSYDEWSTLDWLNYQYRERLSFGAGLGLGYVDVSAGSDMAYEQFQGRVGWRATDKVSFQVHGGVEVRQFLSGGQDDLINPIVGAVTQYQPFEYTRLSLTVDRTVSASYFQSQATENVEIMGSLNQRLLKMLHLDLSGGYHRTAYVASTGISGRTDDYYVFNARLSTAFLKQRGTAAVFYQYSEDSSNLPGFSFTSNQVGFELGYRY